MQQLPLMLYPTYRDFAETAVGIRHNRGGGIGQPKPINPTEAEILRKLGIGISYDEERKQWYTTTMSADLLTKFPLVSFAFARGVNDWKYRNPAAGEDLAEQMKNFALAQTRIVRWYPYNVFKEHERLQKAMSEKAKLIERRSGFENY